MIIYEDVVNRERHEIEWPPTIQLDLEKERERLGWPSYINMDDPWVRRAIGIAAGCRPASEERLRVAFFGGVAFKLHCPSCNDPESPFHRVPGDLDLVSTRIDGRRVVERLCSLANTYGSYFTHFITGSDRTFNALRSGKRYRLSTVHPASCDKPVLCKLDLLVDVLEFCHRLPVTDLPTNDPVDTIGPANLLLSKAQYIKAVPFGPDVPQHRILGSFGRHQLLIGMEDKDLLDVTALLHDHQLGSGPDELDPNQILDRLRSDWGLRRTVTLNLENIAAGTERLAELALDAGTVARVQNRAVELLRAIREAPAPSRPIWGRLAGGQWWETIEDL